MQLTSIPLVDSRHTCHSKSKDGDVCYLYLDHHGPHKSNHNQKSWEDGE